MGKINRHESALKALLAGQKFCFSVFFKEWNNRPASQGDDCVYGSKGGGEDVQNCTTRSFIVILFCGQILLR